MHGQGASNITYTALLFSALMFAGFTITSLLY